MEKSVKRNGREVLLDNTVTVWLMIEPSDWEVEHELYI